MMFLIVRSFWKTFWPGQFPVHATMQFLRRIDVKLQSVPARSQIIEHVVCSFELAVIVSQAFIIILLMKQFHIYIYIITVRCKHCWNYVPTVFVFRFVTREWCLYSCASRPQKCHSIPVIPWGRWIKFVISTAFADMRLLSVFTTIKENQNKKEQRHSCCCEKMYKRKRRLYCIRFVLNFV